MRICAMACKNSLRSDSVKVAGLQSEFWHKIYFWGYEFSYEKSSDILPKMFEPLLRRSENSEIVPQTFPPKNQ